MGMSHLYCHDPGPSERANVSFKVCSVHVWVESTRQTGLTDGSCKLVASIYQHLNMLEESNQAHMQSGL